VASVTNEAGRLPTPSIGLDDLSCTGEEDGLEDCESLPWGEHNCSPSENVRLHCLQEPQFADVGLLTPSLLRSMAESGDDGTESFGLPHPIIIRQVQIGSEGGRRLQESAGELVTTVSLVDSNPDVKVAVMVAYDADADALAAGGGSAAFSGLSSGTAQVATVSASGSIGAAAGTPEEGGNIVPPASNDPAPAVESTSSASGVGVAVGVVLGVLVIAGVIIFAVLAIKRRQRQPAIRALPHATTTAPAPAPQPAPTPMAPTPVAPPTTASSTVTSGLAPAASRAPAVQPPNWGAYYPNAGTPAATPPIGGVPPPSAHLSPPPGVATVQATFYSPPLGVDIGHSGDPSGACPVCIISVTRGGAAELQGVRPGDVIAAVNGQAVPAGASLQEVGSAVQRPSYPLQLLLHRYPAAPSWSGVQQGQAAFSGGAHHGAAGGGTVLPPPASAPPAAYPPPPAAMSGDENKGFVAVI
jgi:hypothetical protein